MAPRKLHILLIALAGFFITGCKESRDDLNRTLVSAGLPYFGNHDYVLIDFAGGKLPVYIGAEESESGVRYFRACCSKERFRDFDPLEISAFSKKGIYRATVSKNYFLLVGVPFDGMSIQDASFNAHAKCSKDRYLFATLNNRQLHVFNANPEALCRKAAP